MSEENMRLAERVRRAVLEAGRDAWQEASLAGLCGEGAWEAAVGGMESLDLAPLVAEEPEPAAPVSSEDERAP